MDQHAEDEDALRAKKRSVTGTGKLMHRQAGKMHLNEHKPSTRTRRLDGDKVVAPVMPPRRRSCWAKSS